MYGRYFGHCFNFPLLVLFPFSPSAACVCLFPLSSNADRSCYLSLSLSISLSLSLSPSVRMYVNAVLLHTNNLITLASHMYCFLTLPPASLHGMIGRKRIPLQAYRDLLPYTELWMAQTRHCSNCDRCSCLYQCCMQYQCSTSSPAQLRRYQVGAVPRCNLCSQCLLVRETREKWSIAPPEMRGCQDDDQIWLSSYQTRFSTVETTFIYKMV